MSPIVADMLRRLPVAFVAALLVAIVASLFRPEPLLVIAVAGLVFVCGLLIEPLNI
jgi:hypothetical protein